jgi:tetratricopeptide (TPR) repeat protein
MGAACASATRIGRVHVVRGEIDQALKRFREALPRCEQAWKARDDTPSGEEFLTVKLMLADALRRNGELGAAVEGYRDVLASAEKLVPKDRSLRKYLAMSHDRIGQTLDQQRTAPEEALAARREFVAVAAQIVADDPSVPRFRRNLGVGHENLAAALADRGLHEEGLGAIARAEALYEALRREDPENVQAAMDLASASNVRARLLRGTGRHEEALAASEKALALLEGPIRGSAQFLQPYDLAAGALSAEGELYVLRRDFAAARQAFEKAVVHREMIASREPAWPENRHALAALYGSLGRVQGQLASGRLNETACDWFARATDLLSRLRDEKAEPVPTDEELAAVRADQTRCRSSSATRS